tara:strand:- start:95 stop:2650 length:2556 start_codon:yes stop_codon:yes gene_type:complete
MPLSGIVFDKKKNKKPALSKRVLDFFEKTRFAYLSAREDPREYGKEWEKAVKGIREKFDVLDDLSETLKKYIEEDDLFSKEALDAQSNVAERMYEKIKEMRFKSDEVNDPFAKTMGDDVIETLLEHPYIYAMFIHYALRAHTHSISDRAWDENDLKMDTITEGAMGLDLAISDIPIYIIEHYGDDKDSSRVKAKFKGALKLLKKVFLSENSEEKWDNLVDIKIDKEEKSKDEKEKVDFVIPNKPMYRIFDVDDIKELKGFTGEWLVQEKYDGMRIQIHKLDDKIKIYSYNNKDITDVCPKIVKRLENKAFKDMILDAELILFDDDEPLHRADTIAHVFKGKYKGHDLKAHVFDIMRHEGESLMDSPLKERINTLFYQLSSHSSEELAFPSKKDTKMADSLTEVKSYATDIMKLPASEGVIIKDLESTYLLGSKKNPKWIKLKKFVDLDLVVLDKSNTKSKLYSYTLGIGPLNAEHSRKYDYIELENKPYLKVGKGLNTKQSVKVGSIVRVKVDEVRKNKNGFVLHSAKIIEIPEVTESDKLETLELLASTAKKSLNYEVEEDILKYYVTDNIHGTAEVILKRDMDGFTIYGFDGDSLMEKNALVDIDLWKEQITNIMKGKESKVLSAIYEFLRDKDTTVRRPASSDEIREFVEKEFPEEFKETWNNSVRELTQRLKFFDGIKYVPTNKWYHSPDFLMKDIEDPPAEKWSKDKGKFQVFLRKDDNLNLVIHIKDSKIAWLIDIENEEDIFNLFGKAGKYPAQVSESIDPHKILDEGKIILGVQKDGYHEYKLIGKKFETRMHFRVVPIDEEDKWIVWTGYKQQMLQDDEDEGVWDIAEDRYKKLTIPDGSTT